MKTEAIMKKVLRLAEKASGMTSPNPMVGAALIKAGKIIAEDYHRKPGAPHAEALVIQNAGEKAKGSTLYVNLEPCCHMDKRTPPCTKAIIKAGIKKVVIGMKDPNPKVSGKGIEELKKTGIEVISGILEEDSKRLNEAYIKYITTGKPFVILKVAMTLDGKIATPEGESKWITGEKAREMVHKLRGSVDAILTAVGTIKADDPQLTARIKDRKDPIRIVIDPNLKIPINARILDAPPKTIIVTEEKDDISESFKKPGVEFITYKGSFNLIWLMEKLGKMEITSLLIEGGSGLNFHALEDRVVDKAMFFIAPKIIGGRESFPAVGGKNFRKLSEAYRLKDIKLRRIGEDILIEGYIE